MSGASQPDGHAHARGRRDQGDRADQVAGAPDAGRDPLRVL